MPYNPYSHHRRSIRLDQYDYSLPGYYFVTLLTYQREQLFGAVINGETQLSRFGVCARTGLVNLSKTFSVEVDEWVIMPDHAHMILAILDSNSRSHIEGDATDLDQLALTGDKLVCPHGTKPGSLSAIVQNYKSQTARRINVLRGSPGMPVWHRNYFERIIRNERELNRIRAYIRDNPRKWGQEREDSLLW